MVEMRRLLLAHQPLRQNCRTLDDLSWHDWLFALLLPHGLLPLQQQHWDPMRLPDWVVRVAHLLPLSAIGGPAADGSMLRSLAQLDNWGGVQSLRSAQRPKMRVRPDWTGRPIRQSRH